MLQKKSGGFIKKMKNLFRLFKVGTIFNPIILNVKNTKPILREITLLYPKRLNAMAIDPSKITQFNNMKYIAGQITFSIQLYTKVNLKLRNDGECLISKRSLRKSVIKHVFLLMKKAIGFNDGFEIDVDEGSDIIHGGLGSTGSIFGGVAVAINEVYGSPIGEDQLLKYLSQNYGEEVTGSEDMLNPVQSVGGSIATGLYNGGILIISGENRVVKIGVVNPDYSVILGYPKNFEKRSSDVNFSKEKNNFSRFKKCGKDYGKDIAYDVFHKILPGIDEKNLSQIGNVIYDYRFNKGSIQNCSFSYPKIVEITKNLSYLKKNNIVDILSISSVGPLVFAITKNPIKCVQAFKKQGLAILKTKIENNKYQILNKTFLKNRKIKVGILGGIGPEATADFYFRFIKSLQEDGKIKQNKEYPQILINSIPAKELILDSIDESDLSDYINGLKELDSFKPDFIVMICNTIYLFKDKLQKKIKSPILDIRKIVEDYLKNKDIGPFLVLGSKGTVKKGLYDFKNIKCHIPNDAELEAISKIIIEYNIGIKSSKQIKIIRGICDKYLNKGVKRVLMGCTEIENLMKNEKIEKVGVMDIFIDSIINKIAHMKGEIK